MFQTEPGHGIDRETYKLEDWNKTKSVVKHGIVSRPGWASDRINRSSASSAPQR